MTVVDPSTVVITHIAEVLRKNADQLIGRDEVSELLTVMAQDSPKLVEELTPNLLSLGEIVAVHVIARPHANVDITLPIGRDEDD